jgi:hypothetical protein
MRFQAQPYPDYIHSLMLNAREEKFAHSLNKTYQQVLSLYRENAYKFKIKTAEDRSPFVQMINMVTKKTLDTENLKLVYFCNHFLNELQCDFVIAEHEKEFKPAFESAHYQINAFILNKQDSTEKQTIQHLITESNYKREHYFDNY